ncbi:MAG: helix-turn-helix domain-containing protein, partial [Chitinophagales bacterium]
PLKSSFNIPCSPAILQYLTSLQYLSQVVKKENSQVFKVKIMEFLTLAIAENEHLNVLTQLKHFTQHQSPQNLGVFMSENFDKPLTIADYAYLTGRSLSTFRREFKAKFGVSPHKWISQERMKKAKEMLEKGNQSVADIAYHVGYENVSHFISAFKKYHGHTPKQTMISEKMCFSETSKVDSE